MHPWSCGLSLAYSPLGSKINWPTIAPAAYERSLKISLAIIFVVLDFPERVIPKSAVRWAMKSSARM